MKFVKCQICGTQVAVKGRNVTRKYCNACGAERKKSHPWKKSNMKFKNKEDKLDINLEPWYYGKKGKRWVV